MSFRIVADSCCDKTEIINKFDNITFVPLTLSIGDYVIPDDENFDQDDFVGRMIASSETAKTACPSPDAWATAYDCDEDDVYVITITDKLSGTYNSALQGKTLFEEEHGEKKNIHVLNSLATAGIESLVAERIHELASDGVPFEQVVEDVEDLIVNRSKLFFCLESLDVLKNNGRLFALATGLLKKLRVRLILHACDGNIKLSGQELSMNRALTKMASFIGEDVKDSDLSDKRLIITHVCCPERAQFVAEKISAYAKFGSVEIVKASGLNTVYMSNGGIIAAYTK